MNSSSPTSNSDRKRVVIAGGGYAGLSSAILLGREPDRFDVTLIDAAPGYLSSIQLHRTVHTPLAKLQINYQSLADRYNFRFLQERLDFDRSLLPRWADGGELPTRSARLPFDYLCLCTGAGGLPIHNETDPELIGTRVLPLDSLKEQSLDGVLARYLESLQPDSAGNHDSGSQAPARIAVIGGGATGIQFLFELDEHLKSTRRPYELSLIDLEERVMKNLSSGFHNYVERRMRERGIAYFPGVRFRRQDDDTLVGERTSDGGEFRLPSGLTLLFPGVSGRPFPMRANRHGQVEVAGNTLSRVFAAGDCAHYDASGMNAPTAQAAVRKGRLVAENILRLERGESLQSYTYPELGYFLSMGPWDGIGWMFVRFNVLTGVAAFAVKEAIELQFRLFLEGIDTYVAL